jgi:hypothetical protein
VTLAAVTICWLIFGVYIYLFSINKINTNNIITHSGFLLVAFTYLNAMRERNRYGDISYYIEAGEALLKGKHLPDSYFYPPLWATFLRFIVPYGEDITLTIAWVLNILSLFLFFFLLQKTLIKYGFGMNTAAISVAIFLLANTAVFRTLGYVQVNLHVLNFILGSLLLFDDHKSLSALCLAFAIHLKASPAVLVLAFLLELNFSWVIWLGIHLIWISGLSYFTVGLQPFMDFLNNAVMMSSNHEIVSYRDVSFDAIFNTLGQFNGFISHNWRVLALVSKLTLGLVALRFIFPLPSGPGARLMKSLPILLILMTMASPIVWEHHSIFLALPFLILLKKIDTPQEWTLYIFAFFFQFVIPAFDFFPWSYVRFISPFVILWLLWKTQNQESSTFKSTNAWFTSLSQNSKP